MNNDAKTIAELGKAICCCRSQWQSIFVGALLGFCAAAIPLAVALYLLHPFVDQKSELAEAAANACREAAQEKISAKEIHMDVAEMCLKWHHIKDKSNRHK
ncbi:MAG: hypothetical protein ACK4RS_00200 [Thiothrix sp.]